MKKYSGDKFKHTLDETIKERMKINGIVFTSKAELLEYLHDKLGVSVEALKKWQRSENTGPKDPVILKSLEEILDTSLQVDVEETLLYKRWPDTVKSSVNKLSGAFNVFVEGYIEDEEKYWKLIEKMRRLKPSIPPHLYNELEMFQQKYLEPFVLFRWEAIPEAYSEKCGYWNEKGQFHVTDEKLFFSIFFQKQEEIKVQLDKIINTKVHPIIFS